MVFQYICKHFPKKGVLLMFNIGGIPGRQNDFFPKNRSRQKFHRLYFSIFFSKFQKEVLEHFRPHLTYYQGSRNFDPFYFLGAKYQNMQHIVPHMSGGYCYRRTCNIAATNYCYRIGLNAISPDESGQNHYTCRSDIAIHLATSLSSIPVTCQWCSNPLPMDQLTQLPILSEGLELSLGTHKFENLSIYTTALPPCGMNATSQQYLWS